MIAVASEFVFSWIFVHFWILMFVDKFELIFEYSLLI
ncbi:hypothetical protein M6B38_366665 [Iris pallida]|uniref:Uncharacterized protein n=1 Tax=Iris pallida TaxID=29817 RepID=A0AAX6GHC6_IRIPA|nr:hypothetical protein M6B38_189590 [Iris pallida]KAJ6827728.1 hypothetical protein M6B38_366665 [Iris pallida]